MSMNLTFLEPLKDIPQDMFEQSEGTFRKGKSCCFGAHLAHTLLNETSYEKGKAEFMKKLNLNEAEMILLFRSAGLKIKNPFSSVAWDLPVKTVIENMEKIKEIPKTRGANLYRANLGVANLEGATLEGANLEYANFDSTNLVKANLSYANLSDAHLSYANLEEANLEEANLKEANLYKANLYKANLERANLERAYLEKANLEDCKFPTKHEYLLSREQKEQVIWVA